MLTPMMTMMMMSLFNNKVHLGQTVLMDTAVTVLT